MLSIVVAANQEADTVGRAIDSFLGQQLPEPWELLVVSPDEPTGAVVARYAAMNGRVRQLRDQAKGKPAALNLALQLATGDILLLSDGDVFVGAKSVQALLQPFEDPEVGIVSGRPISVNPRTTMLGYWSHLLVDAGAHAQRTLRNARGRFLECSGYLYAFRRSLVRSIPEDALAEDGLISYLVWQQGYRTAYAPEAEVFVRFPSTYSDWVRQKVRTAGGYAQPYLRGSEGIKSFHSEALHGTLAALRYARSPRELAWTLLLFAARLHVWLLVWRDVRWRKKPFTAVWQRVDSTKHMPRGK